MSTIGYAADSQKTVTKVFAELQEQLLKHIADGSVTTWFLQNRKEMFGFARRALKQGFVEEFDRKLLVTEVLIDLKGKTKEELRDYFDSWEGKCDKFPTKEARRLARKTNKAAAKNQQERMEALDGDRPSARVEDPTTKSATGTKPTMPKKGAPTGPTTPKTSISRLSYPTVPAGPSGRSGAQDTLKLVKKEEFVEIIDVDEEPEAPRKDKGEGRAVEAHQLVRAQASVPSAETIEIDESRRRKRRRTIGSDTDVRRTPTVARVPLPTEASLSRPIKGEPSDGKLKLVNNKDDDGYAEDDDEGDDDDGDGGLRAPRFRSVTPKAEMSVRASVRSLGLGPTMGHHEPACPRCAKADAVCEKLQRAPNGSCRRCRQMKVKCERVRLTLDHEPQGHVKKTSEEEAPPSDTPAWHAFVEEITHRLADIERRIRSRDERANTRLVNVERGLHLILNKLGGMANTDVNEALAEDCSTPRHGAIADSHRRPPSPSPTPRPLSAQPNQQMTPLSKPLPLSSTRRSCLPLQTLSLYGSPPPHGDDEENMGLESPTPIQPIFTLQESTPRGEATLSETVSELEVPAISLRTVHPDSISRSTRSQSKAEREVKQVAESDKKVGKRKVGNSQLDDAKPKRSRK